MIVASHRSQAKVWENAMPKLLVNLDAMIQREDLEEVVESSDARTPITDIRLTDLEQSTAFFNSVRKPDFQRSTADWSPDTVADLIRSFTGGEFIPSLIVWHSDKSGKFFVIDGSHRLSALIGWVNNDYGDGPLSKKFLGDDGITDAQKKRAKRTRQLVEDVGTYAELKIYAEDPNRAPNDKIATEARKIFNTRMAFQLVGGDAKIAERSFFKINMSAATIDSTELSILKARNKPNAIATRALIHAGRGHKFWRFGVEQQGRIESLASNIHEILFKPILEDPIKTIDLPIAGNSYTPHTFQMFLDLVNMINDVTDSMWMDQSKTRRKSKDAAQEKRIDDDTDGAMTIQFLEKVLSSAYLITGDHAGSLGLHPAVYFYGSNGRFYPAALLAAIKYFSRIKRNGKLLHFTQHRRGFEEFLIHHRLFIKQLCHIKGSRMRAVDSLVAMYEVVLGEVGANSDDQSIISKLKEDSRLSRLDETEGQSSPQRRRFSGDAKSAAFLREAVDSPIRCAHCDARLHSRSMSADHEQRLQDGGSGGSENLQWMHFFCNTGAKESEHSMSKRAGE